MTTETLPRGQQERLPGRRDIDIFEFRVGNGPVTRLRVGKKPDGTPGEIFISQSKTGTFARGMTDSFARLLSLSLQCGVPLERVCDLFAGTKFEPSGFVEGDDIEADSLVDYIVTLLKREYL